MNFDPRRPPAVVSTTKRRNATPRFRKNAQICFHALKTAGGEQLTCENRFSGTLKVKETNPDSKTGQEPAVLA